MDINFSDKIKVILFSKYSLPYNKIGSWTSMYNYYLQSEKNLIDFIVCPKNHLLKKEIRSEYVFTKGNSFFNRVLLKLKIRQKHCNFHQSLKLILKDNDKVIVQIVDDIGLLKSTVLYIQNNKLRDKVYIQYFYHGFLPFIENIKTYEQIDELILLSKSSLNYFENHLSSFPVKVNILANGVNSEIFNISSRKEHFDDKLSFVWCSQNRKKKGLEIILSAWCELYPKYEDQIELNIFGCDYDISFPGVKNHGKVDHEILAEYYKKMDIFLFPTLCQEGFGLSLVEALKSGLLCVGSTYGAVPEVLNYGDFGILVNNPNLVSSWVYQIEQLIKLYENDELPNFLIPDSVYDLKDWVTNYNEIIVNGKKGITKRFFL